MDSVNGGEWSDVGLYPELECQLSECSLDAYTSEAQRHPSGLLTWIPENQS